MLLLMDADPDDDGNGDGETPFSQFPDSISELEFFCHLLCLNAAVEFTTSHRILNFEWMDINMRHGIISQAKSQKGVRALL